nr:2Fe-2S iron-sulfur cluster-binding protein [Pectobacterium versatile]
MGYTYTIRDLTTGAEIQAPKNVCILDSLEEAGVDSPYSCRAGSCSSCAALLITGIVDQSDGSFLSDEQKVRFILTCSAYPQSNCIIRTGVEWLLEDEEKAEKVFFEDWQRWN